MEGEKNCKEDGGRGECVLACGNIYNLNKLHMCQ